MNPVEHVDTGVGRGNGMVIIHGETPAVLRAAERAYPPPRPPSAPRAASTRVWAGLPNQRPLVEPAGPRGEPVFGRAQETLTDGAGVDEADEGVGGGVSVCPNLRYEPEIHTAWNGALRSLVSPRKVDDLSLSPWGPALHFRL